MPRHLLAVLWFLLALPEVVHAQQVHVITLDASINPATADYITTSIRRAGDDGAAALVIRLDTPGGLLKSTRQIVSAILEAPLPVIVYIAPSGAQGASAGAFITLAGHVAAMAPGTNIGAAHPVGLQGSGGDSVSSEKAVNDAAAFIRSISERRHRNIRWAEDAVRRSVAVSESEALRDSVIDVVAPSAEALLDSIHGRRVEVRGDTVTLSTAEAAIRPFEMDWKHRLLNTLSDPNIAYIFFLLGLYGLFFELYNPGAVLPGVVGGIAIIIAFYSLHTLPVNYAGLALIVFAVILFIAEVKVTSYGLLTVGGVVSLLLGSIMLIDPESPLEVVGISWSVLLPAVLCTLAFFLFAIGMGIRAQRRKPVTGMEGIAGETGEALTDLAPSGQVRVHGEIWRARSESGTLAAGTRVVVVRMQDLELTVRAAGG
jgi:membrane-bound serine protease (ClpP class)